MSEERTHIIKLVSQAQEWGARQSKACELIGLSAKTLQRCEQAGNTQDGRVEVQHTPANKLSELERQRIIKTVNSPKFAHLPPSKIVPKLADEGTYMGSESTFYRVMNTHNQLAHRDKSKPNRTITKPKALTANAPNQIYTWDITYLPTSVRGIFVYLYLVLDIYSRKVVGWQVHSEELSALAADLMVDICLRERVKPEQVTLHSDNGSPMKGATMLATLQQLGVIPSFSRPSVSNDNPYSESIFRTLKYNFQYPEKPFNGLESARDWVQQFVQWYNYEHLHSGIKFVTPEQSHNRLDTAILKQRKVVYNTAKSEHPNRWSGKIRDWDPITEVHLNPEKHKSKLKQNKAA
jgi:putative transposase